MFICIQSLVTSQWLANFTYTEQIFKSDFIGNDVSYENILFYIFDLFFHVESHPCRLYHGCAIVIETPCIHTHTHRMIEFPSRSNHLLFLFISFYPIRHLLLSLWRNAAPPVQFVCILAMPQSSNSIVGTGHPVYDEVLSSSVSLKFFRIVRFVSCFRDSTVIYECVCS